MNKGLKGYKLIKKCFVQIEGGENPKVKKFLKKLATKKLRKFLKTLDK